MPYIKQIYRPKFEEVLKDLPTIDNAGELNYLITRLIMKYEDAHQRNYQTINDISGAVHNAYLEYERRIVGRYEDMKIQENGDVYY